MAEPKPVLHATIRNNYLEHKETQARPSGDKTWNKFGIEQNIQDFINAGVEQTSMMKHVENAGGIEHLKAAGIKDVDDTVIDRSIDIVTMNRFIKVVNVAAKKLAEEKAAEQNQQEEQKGE